MPKKFQATLDDLGINSTETADYFYKRLKKSGHNNIVVDVKPGGHLIDAPYVPHMDFVWNKYFGKNIQKRWKPLKMYGNP